MNKYGSLCDDSYMNMHLNTEMDLPQNREVVLHFFEQIQKRYPKMSNFYARERGEFCLEEEKEAGQYRWVSIEPRRLCSGSVNMNTIDEAIEQHATILGVVPYTLSISHLDCETLNATMGFDYVYRGNHNELLAEALGLMPAMEKLTEIQGSSIVGCEPAIQIALDEECKTQCRISFETRTTAYQVRTGEYGEEPLSVYLTVRRYDSLTNEEQYAGEFARIAKLCEQLVDDYLVDNVLRPLQNTIALK